MGFFASLRDKNKIIKALVNFQKTVWYPIIFSALCIVSGLNNYTVYVPIMYLLAVFALFSALFTDDNMVFLTPLFMIYFALGRDNPTQSFYQSDGDMLAFMNKDAIKHLIVIGVIGVGAFIVRLIADGSILSIFKRRRHFTFGIIALDIAYLLNGLLSPAYSVSNMRNGAFIAMGVTVVYFLVAGMLESSRDPVPYACRAAVCAAYTALIQITVMVLRLHSWGYLFVSWSETPKLNKDSIVLGWGVSTVVAGIFVLGIPAAMYLAKRSRLCILLYASPLLFIAGTLVINTRGPMLVGAAVFIACAVSACIKSKNKVTIRICLGATALLGIAAVIYVHFKIRPINELLSILRLENITDSGRGEMWLDGIEDFKKAPIFGAGFADGAYPDSDARKNVFSNMYHCILIEFPGAMGIVGCLAFILHIWQLCRLFFKRFSSDKMMLLMVPCMILTMSLLDNFFFYLDFQLFYGAFLALSEISLRDSEKKDTEISI